MQINHGIRLDTNYYFWPEAWVKNVPGHFTGSAMPMRFADLDGTILDSYQVVTQMSDESGQTFPFTSDTLLSRAAGPEEQYGVYTVNAHTDSGDSPEARAVVASARTSARRSSARASCLIGSMAEMPRRSATCRGMAAL